MLTQYDRLIRDKLSFLYGGEQAPIVYRRRKILFLLSPAAAAVLFMLLLFGGNRAALSALYAVCFCGGICGFYDGAIFRKAKNRCLQMRFELSDLLDRIALLLDAGVTLWNAIVIVSEDGGEGALLWEIRQTVRQFSSADGYYYEPEAAFEELARRCADPSVSTFVSLIVQNARKGTAELAELLRIQSVHARNERRMLAKQLSDEAATLMLIPSAIVLAAVLVLTAAPAVIQFF